MSKRNIWVFLFFVAFNIIIEFLTWFIVGGKSNLYPYVNNQIIWLSKNLLLSLIFTTFYLINNKKNIENEEKRTSNKHSKFLFYLLIIFLSLITFILMHLGHGGGPLCGVSCDGAEVIIVYSLYTPIIIIVLSFLIYFTYKLIDNYIDSKIFVVCISLISIAIIVLSLIQTTYVINLNNNNKKIFDEILMYPFLLDVGDTLLSGYSSNDWFSLCRKYRRSSLNIDILGSIYADNCYYAGVLFFNEKEYCNYSGDIKERCIKDYKEINSPDKISLSISNFKLGNEIIIDNIEYYEGEITLRKRNYAEFDGGEVYIDDIKIADLPKIIINDLNYVTVQLKIEKNKIKEVLEAKENEENENYHQATLILKYNREIIGSQRIISCFISRCPPSADIPSRNCPWIC